MLSLSYALTPLILTIILQVGVLKMSKLRKSEVTFITQVGEREFECLNSPVPSEEPMHLATILIIRTNFSTFTHITGNT